MRYPQELVDFFGGAADFARKASAHPDAPRRLTRDAVYMWRQRNVVPWAWRNVVRDLGAAVLAQREKGAA